jgi:hypothetical protein
VTGTPAAVAPAKARRLDIDRAKGLGIFLVVLGHLAAKSQPAGNVWFAYLQTAVYQFHMPFFMFLSGYVWYLSGAARTPAPKWTQMVRRRVWRFIIPFVLFGLALVAGKFAAAHFIHVDHAPDSVADALLGLVWDTDNSPAISVWYILVVFAHPVVDPGPHGTAVIDSGGHLPAARTARDVSRPDCTLLHLLFSGRRRLRLRQTLARSHRCLHRGMAGSVCAVGYGRRL